MGSSGRVRRKFLKDGSLALKPPMELPIRTPIVERSLSLSFRPAAVRALLGGDDCQLGGAAHPPKIFGRKVWFEMFGRYPGADPAPQTSVRLVISATTPVFPASKPSQKSWRVAPSGLATPIPVTNTRSSLLVICASFSIGISLQSPKSKQDGIPGWISLGAFWGDNLI